MAIFNLTQHPGTADQQVVEPTDKAAVQALLTFNEMPPRALILERAEALAKLVEGADAAMIGGAPFLMPALERALQARGIRPLYAFSKREVVEQDDGTGGVRKVTVFRHLGFVEAV